MEKFAAVLAAIGAVILLSAMHRSRRLFSIAPVAQRHSWRVLIALMCCFVAGYLGFAWVLLAGVSFPTELLVGMVFLGGALFVLTVLTLSMHTIEKLHVVNNNLEELVKHRTSEVELMNSSLLVSQQQLQGQKEFLETVLNSLSHPFYVIDLKDYTISLANEACGFAPPDDGAKPICYKMTHHQDVPCDSNDHPCPADIIRRTGKPVILEHIHYDTEGRERYVEIHGYPIYDHSGELSQMIEYVLDITKRKHVEHAIIRARKEAESANLAKSEFLANMSHEVRTPMNAIVGMTNLALATELSGLQRHYIKTVQDSSELLLNIVNDILDFSKIEAGKLELDSRPFHLSNVLNSVIRVLKLKASGKGLGLVLVHEPLDIGISVVGDDLRLRQVLINLVGNAIKFTSSGEVSIICEEELHEDELTVAFFVSDTGIGIGKEAQAKIFETFYQADTSISRSFGGTGLGLAISQKLVRQMGSEITITSEIGSGSTFSFAIRFPIAEEEVLVDNGGLVPPQYTMPLDLLLVDDIMTNRDLGRVLLETAGHSVTEAENGLDALKKLSEKQFDGIFLDIQMPILDGLQVTEYIRISEEGGVADFGEYQELMAAVTTRLHGGHIPIVAMTAHAMSGDRKKCLDAGMDGYISKPFQPNEMYGQLSVLCGKRNI